MIDPFAYIYLLPLGIIVAILAISAGISGSNFWIPIYFMWLGIDPKTSFWLALLTMIFGFGSGIIRNMIHTTINWTIVKQYLKIAVPFAILGTLLVPFTPATLLLGLFGSVVIIYGAFLIYRFGLFHKKDESSVPGGKDLLEPGCDCRVSQRPDCHGNRHNNHAVYPQALQNPNSRGSRWLNGGDYLRGKSFCSNFSPDARFYSHPCRTERLDIQYYDLGRSRGHTWRTNRSPCGKEIVGTGNSILCWNIAGIRWNIDILENIFRVLKPFPHKLA